MTSEQREVEQAFLDNEKRVLKSLKENYQTALNDINAKITELTEREDSNMQYVVYQLEYQKALKKQVEGILEQLHSNEFDTISQYLAKAYEEGFIGTMYDLQSQGIPLVFPIDQEQVVAAIQHETKLSESLYSALGKDVKKLSTQIASEISRGISNGSMAADIARNIASYAGISMNKAMRIARTEGHRIQEKATNDAHWKAKSKGADIVKIWSAALDSRTREDHRRLDGQIRELDEPFEIDGHEAMFPSDFGIAELDINCRCRCNSKARWLLDAPATKYAEGAPIMISDDGTTQYVKFTANTYQEAKEQYWEIQRSVADNAQKTISLENTEKSDRIISTKQANSKIINGTTVANPMDADKYEAMKEKLESNGIHVIQAVGDDLRYLQALGAEASYGNGYIMHIGEIPSASGFFEEIIHSTQAKKYGEFSDSDQLELYAREVAANRMLLKYGDAYGFDETDYEDIERNLAIWEKRFEGLVGGSYDESDYSREI